MELGIRLGFVKTSEKFRGGFERPKPPLWVRQCGYGMFTELLVVAGAAVCDIRVCENVYIKGNCVTPFPSYRVTFILVQYVLFGRSLCFSVSA
jgi:hypothetical protein